MEAIALKSLVIFGAAWIAAMVARQCSAAARHLIWTAAMAAALALPMLSVSLPPLHFRAADRMLAPGVTFLSNAVARTDSSSPAHDSAPLRHPKPAPWRPDWENIAATVWSIGTAVMCLRLLWAWMVMWRLRSASEPMALDLTSLCRSLGIYRPVRALETTTGTMPMLFGWIRPIIFLPADVATWTEARKRAVLLHELAHVRRHDAFTQILGQLALSFYWWNPLASIAWREFLKMRERAADDLVLDAGTCATDYAGHLVDVARSASFQAGAIAVGMAHGSELEGRVVAILNTRLNRKSPGRAAVLSIALAAIAVVAPMAAVHAQDAAALPADVDATIRTATSQKNYEMLDRLAAEFVQAGQIQPAQQLLEASLAIRGSAAGERSSIYAEGLIHLGDLSRRLGIANDYEKAVALGDQPATVPALLSLGIMDFNKTAGKAQDYFQRALNADPKGVHAAEAMAWMGAARALQGETADAESWFSRAAAAMPAEAASDRALVLEMYAQFLKAQGRLEESAALQARAFGIRKDRVAAMSPKAAGLGQPRKIGNGVMPPSVLSKIEPEYTLEAQVMEWQGTVELGLLIDANGIPRDIALKQGIGFGLDEKAIEAVRRWRFKPGSVEGTPVPVIATIQVNFRLL